MYKDAIQLAKLGKRTLSLLPLRGGNLRKAKKSARSFIRLSARDNNKADDEPTLESMLLDYQQKLALRRAQRPKPT